MTPGKQLNSDKPNSLFGGSKWRHRSTNPVPQNDVKEDDVVFTLAHMDTTFASLSSDGLVKKQIVRVGNGQGFVEGSYMTIHYEVYAFDTNGKLCEKPFDSSWERPDEKDDSYPDRTVAIPKEYRLMSGEVIGVLDAGVATMEVGEIANFVARGPYAYGDFGIPDTVGPNAPVFLHVEVLQGLEPTTVQHILQGVLTDRDEATLDEIFEAVTEFKKKGNTAHEHGNLKDALLKYKRGLSWTETEDDDRMPLADVKRFRHIRFAIINNMAICYLKLKKFRKVVKICTLALNSPESTEASNGDLGKMYYRLAAAQFELKDYDKAADSITKAKELLPWNLDVLRLYAKIREIVERQNRQGNMMWRKIAAGFFN